MGKKLADLSHLVIGEVIRSTYESIKRHCHERTRGAQEHQHKDEVKIAPLLQNPIVKRETKETKCKEHRKYGSKNYHFTGMRLNIVADFTEHKDKNYHK